MSSRAGRELGQLSLFDALHSTGRSGPAPAGSGVGKPARRPRGASPADASPAGSVSSTVVAELLALEIFRHPQADREIRLGDHRIAYCLRRVRRRSIGFMVGAEGLSVNAPKWIGIGDIESALREKSKWILRKLADQQERSRRLAAARIDWRDGTTIPYLGAALRVVVDARASASPDGALLGCEAAETEADALPGGPQMTLRIGLPQSASAAQLRDAVQCWLQRQARRLFDERCVVYAKKIGVRHSRVRISSAQTRWGSASADGTIRLNWRLIHFSPTTIDYVVAHELAHLREMNHSPRFWDVVRSAFPNFEAARESLKAGSVPMFD